MKFNHHVWRYTFYGVTCDNTFSRKIARLISDTENIIAVFIKCIRVYVNFMPVGITKYKVTLTSIIPKNILVATRL